MPHPSNKTAQSLHSRAICRLNGRYQRTGLRVYLHSVIKTIGDSIMAQFSDPKSAVQAAVEMQWRRFELNAALPEPKRAHRNVS